MKRIARTLFALFVALAGVAAAVGLGRGGIETDLFSLVGGRDDIARLAALNEQTGSRIRVLCADEARAEKCRAAYRFDEPADPAAMMETVRTRGKGLLAPKTRALLEAGETNRVRRAAIRRDYAGVGLFPKTDDPYYFLSDFLTALAAIRPEGVLLTADGGDTAGLLRLVALAREDEGIALSGSPFHTALATERTKKEINFLGAVSLVAVFAIGFVLFRSPRFVVPLALALASAFAVGAASVTLLPGRPHALVFLFGTTLVGLGVDYVYHALAEHDAGRKLFAAFATTALAFTPLVFSGVAILRLIAVFTLAGLFTVYGFVRLWCAR